MPAEISTMQYYHLCSYRLRNVRAGYVLYNALILSDVLLGEGYTIHKITGFSCQLRSLSVLQKLVQWHCE